MEAFGEQLAALLAALPPDPHGAQRSATGPAPVAPTLAPDAPSVAIGARGDTPAAYSAFQPPNAAPRPITPSPPGIANQPLPGYAAPPVYAPPPDPRGFAASAPPAQGYLPPPVLQNPPGYAVTHRIQPRLPGARPAGGKLSILPIAAVAVAVAAVIALAVASLKKPVTRSGPDHAEAPRGEQRSDEHDRPATPPVQDQWGISTPLDGNKIGVGQGVQLVIPSTFETTVKDGVTIAQDGTGILIMAGLIDIPTDDPMELARYHAKRNGFVFDTMKTIFVGGVERPMAIFHGTYRSVTFRHIAVALIGPGYRVAVMFQAPTRRFTDDRSLEARVLELYTRRIVLP